MLIRKVKIIITHLVVFCLFCLNNSFADELYKQFVIEKQSKYSSSDNKDDLNPISGNIKKYRIGILESGVWSGFVLYFKALVEGLTTLGWGKIDVLENLTIKEQIDIKVMIEALNKKGWSDYIDFPTKAYRKMTLETRKKDTEALVSTPDLDMIIGFGTWAGQDLRALPDTFKIPCLISAVSKPIESKIIDSVNDSGKDNITGRVEIDRFKRQIQLFHDVMGFKKIGVVYSGIDPTGSQYAAIPDVEAVKEQRRFEVAISTDVPPSGDIQEINRKFIENVEKLVKEEKIDAFYLTLQNGVNLSTLPKLLEIFNSNKVSTFYMGGSDYVRKGILLSIATNWAPIGIFEAKNTIRILKGAKPRDLNLLFEGVPSIAINIETAKIIGYDPPVDILATADEIYSSIEK
ncbi:MAG: hypothetical protein HQK79_13185 [Desulfobacterales bacterium]|nr:hypothetical protein [Desulfobacterales bacterium]